MAEKPTLVLREALTEKLAESLAAPIPEGTRRDVTGILGLPGKATVVVGMRRSGKTTFLHQLRRDRLVGGAARIRLPYINFEDERLVGLQGAQLGFLLEEYGRQVPEAEGPARGGKPVSRGWETPVDPQPGRGSQGDAHGHYRTTCL